MSSDGHSSKTSADLQVPEKVIKKLSALLKQTDLAEIEIATDSMKLRVKAREPATTNVSMSSPVRPVERVAEKATASAEPDVSGDLHIIQHFIGRPAPPAPPLQIRDSPYPKAKCSVL
jgi:hypothetical protein